MFYLAMSYGDHSSITRGFDSHDEAYAYLAQTARRELLASGDEWLIKNVAKMPDEKVVAILFNEGADGHWVITNQMNERYNNG
jgi:hypothetical protein